MSADIAKKVLADLKRSLGILLNKSDGLPLPMPTEENMVEVCKRNIADFLMRRIEVKAEAMNFKDRTATLSVKILGDPIAELKAILDESMKKDEPEKERRP